MRTSLLVLLLAVFAWGRTSLTVTGGTPLQASLPNTAPFNNMTAATPARWEFRIHAPTALPGTLLQIPTQQVIYSGGTIFLTQTQNGPAGDVATFALINCCGTSDFEGRIQRDTANSRYTFEMCDTQSNVCTSALLPATFGTQVDWTGKAFKLFAGYSVAYFRWFSTVVPVGTAIQQSATGDVADWEFQSSLVDSVQGIAFSGSTVNYTANTPLYPPSCVSGIQQSFRAGTTGSVDGSGSQPLDFGGPLKFQWQQVSGVSPTTVRWTTPQNAATASFTGMVFGPYNFQLTVTDSSGVPNSCTVHDGAVATDNNGLVVFPDTPFGQAARLLLGGTPTDSGQVQWGKNPWSYQDLVHKAMADQQASVVNTIYAPVWDTPLAGTISTTNNSDAIVGVGTTFKADFCGGGTTGDGSYFVRWPSVSVTNGTSRARKLYKVLTCTDDTHLTIEDDLLPPNFSGVDPPHDDATAGILGTESGQPYSKLDGDHFYIWQNGGWSNPANYYDNGMAYASLYLRTGWDTALNAFRTLMDTVWESPLWDRGRAWSPQVGNAYGPPPRAVGYVGLVLRALDNPPYDMWTGLRLLSSAYITAMGPVGNDRLTGWNSLYDTREEAYHLRDVSICAMVDPDATQSAACRASVRDSFPPIWTKFGPDTDGAWKMWWHPNGPFSNATAHAQVTNGSTSVIGVNTTWAIGIPGSLIVFADVDPSTNPSPPGAGNWLLPNPRSNLATSGVYYAITANPDSTHITLDRPYTGTTNSNAMFAVSDKNSDTVWTGWGAQPFMESILADAFNTASLATACTGTGVPTNCDNTVSALARTYHMSAATWVKTTGYKAATHALWYARGWLNCQDPTPDAQCSFDQNGDTGTTAEGWRGLHTAYVYNRDAGWKSFLNTLHNYLWAKPGSCLSAPCDDSGGVYNTFTEPASGFYLESAAPWSPAGSPKWFGVFFGVGVNTSWPYWSMGGITPKVTASTSIQFRMADVPTATKVVVTVTSTEGNVVVNSPCTASPCSINLATNRGKNLLSLQYQNSGGAALATSSMAIEQ